MIRLAHVLKVPKSSLPPINLRVLTLSGNTISDLGTETIAGFLRTNKTVQYLDLSKT